MCIYTYVNIYIYIYIYIYICRKLACWLADDAHVCQPKAAAVTKRQAHDHRCTPCHG